MTELFPAFPPFLIYFLGALLVPLVKGPIRQGVALLVPAIALLNFFQIQSGTYWEFDILTFHLVLGRADAWSMLFLNIFTILSLFGIIYIIKDNDPLDLSAGLLYAGAAMGVVMAGELISFFLFWEMLTVGGVMCLLARRSAKSGAAGFRYFVLHVFGGVILLAGILLYYSETGSLAFEEIGLSSPATWLIFIGLGINCAWPVLGAWLTDTYPEASIGGVVFMATFTTKSAVFVLARTFPGQPELIWIGLAMAIIPLIYAAIENDLRRVLAYCLINQVGFMVIGIGIGTDLSLNGTAAHAYCHILYKAMLFMTVGCVIYTTGKSKLTELGGLYKSMPVTCLLGCLAALSISTPFFCGFVSKSMIISAAGYGAEEHPGYIAIWLALLFASAGVFMLAGIKVIFGAFFTRDAGIRCKEAPANMLLALILAAGLSIVVGCAPNLFLYKMLPTEATYQPYTYAHVFDQFGLQFFAGGAFALLILGGVFPAAMRSTNIDFDWLYRKGGRAFYWVMDKGLNGTNDATKKGVMGLVSFAKSLPRSIPFALTCIIFTPYWVLRGKTRSELKAELAHLETQAMTGTWPIGLTACLAVLLLAILFLT